MGPVEPEHYVIASFKTYGKFENKKLQELHARGFNPLQSLKGWRTAYAIDRKSWAERFKI